MRLEINEHGVNEWLSTQWFMYASTSGRKPMEKKCSLRFYTSCLGRFKVLLGEDVQYEGTDKHKAIEIFNNLSCR